MLQVQPSILRTIMSNTGWGDLDPDTIKKAVRDEGVAVIQAVVRDKETMRAFWSAGIEAAQDHAQTQAGKWALSGLSAIAKRLILAVALAGVVYATGGWSALKVYLAVKP